jgi:hypothetical protein
VDLGQLSKLGTVIVTDPDLPVQAAEAVIILITLIPMELLLLMEGPKGIRHGCLTARIRSWKPLAVAVALLPYHSMPIPCKSAVVMTPSNQAKNTTASGPSLLHIAIARTKLDA